MVWVQQADNKLARLLSQVGIALASASERTHSEKEADAAGEVPPVPAVGWEDAVVIRGKDEKSSSGYQQWLSVA